MKQALNILHFSPVKNWGGGGNHIENLCYELSKTNPEIRNIIVVAKTGKFHERLKKSDFNYSTVSLDFNLDPRAIFKFIRLCKREKIDLVHLHGSTALTLGVIATRLAKLPPFVFSKKTVFPIKQRKQTLYKYNHPHIRKILCVSEAAKRVAEKAIKDKDKLIKIYHGTRLDNKSSKTSFSLREKLKIPPGTRIVGHIGKHIPAKDLITWILAINYLLKNKNTRDITFVQFGSFTEQTPAILEKIRELNLQDVVHLMGYIENASNFMGQFDMLCISSKSEGLPQVIYEAAWHKIPVVSTNVGGISEFIESNSSGLLSPPEDALTLANNIEKILDDPTLGNLMAENAYKNLKSPFTAEAMAQATLNVYHQVLKNEKE